LKQKLTGLEPVTEEKFTQLAGMRIALLHVNLSVVVVTYFHLILQIVVPIIIITTATPNRHRCLHQPYTETIRSKQLYSKS
jgi:nitrate/nitrite-specific signal transduction histidine kinase